MQLPTLPLLKSLPYERTITDMQLPTVALSSTAITSVVQKSLTTKVDESTLRATTFRRKSRSVTIPCTCV
jgi:hypothetical protein